MSGAAGNPAGAGEAPQAASGLTIERRARGRCEGWIKMKTEVVAISRPELGLTDEEDAALRRAGAVLKEGGLVAFPTETVYGLGGDGLNRESSKKDLRGKGASLGQSPDRAYL